MFQAVDLGVLHLIEGQPGSLFALRHTGLVEPVQIGAPMFEIEGQLVGSFQFHRLDGTRALPNGGQETLVAFTCGEIPGVVLQVAIRSFPSSPIVRFQYRLAADHPVALTKTQGVERLTYMRLHYGILGECKLAEYQLSHFDQVIHSYMPLRVDWAAEELYDGLAFAGPAAFFHKDAVTLLVAYEHGADHPDRFLEFAVEANDEIALRAVRGNTYHGQILSNERPWTSVWFQVGLRPGDLTQFLPVYRNFFLEEVCENRVSRTPYIFYNTWNYQERQKYFHGRPYLESMHAGRMLEEIEAAHRIGVDVFVVDTGWYIKTGDWLPNLQRFPEGLREIKRKLDQYGMKLGLWFNPTVAALTSRVFTEHPEWEMTWNGQPRGRHAIWETEVSTGMCLASDYAEDYIEAMVRLHEELGVSYFKWDGVQQYGCNSPLHNHGTEANSPEERADCYAYQMGRAMIHITEEITRRCPGSIVDFDITEHGRFVGLGFAAVGKLYLVNNGPYFSELDIPRSVKIDPDTINVFFYPGPARPRVCRQGAKYDELLPSVLFMTHYLTDGPQLSQRNSVASLVLGGNGVWGDLPALSEEEMSYLAEQIGLYKRVRDLVKRAYPKKRGFPGSSPEIHEKIVPEEAGGVVVIFTVTPGTMTYATQPIDTERLGDVIGADVWEVLPGGRLKLTVTLQRDDARVVTILPKFQL